MMGAAAEPELAALERLGPSIAALLEVRSWAELWQFIQRHPELLTEEADVLLDKLAATARLHQDDDTAEAVENHRMLLRRVRDVGLDAAFADEAGLATLLEAALRAEQRYLQTGDLRELDDAVNTWRLVLPRVDKAFQIGSLPIILNTFAGTLLRRHWATGRVDDLDDAILELDRAAELASAGSLERRSILGNLATSLLARFKLAGTLADLEWAVSLYEQVLAETPGGSPELPSHLINAALSLSERFRAAGSLSDLDRAIDAYRRAVRLTPTGSTISRSGLTNLGNALQDRYRVSGAIEDLDRAVQAFEDAVEATPPGSKDLPAHVGNLGNAAVLRYERSGDPRDLDTAITAYRRGIQLLGSQSVDRLTYLANLGTSLRMRHERSSDPADLKQAIRAYRKSCREGLNIHAESVLRTARTWGDWAWQRRAWQEAAQAYVFGLTAADRLVDVQLARRHKEAWLRAGEGLPVRAAYALGMSGDLQQAVVVLERGRNLLLSETLEHERVELDRIKFSGRSDLVELYLRAAGRLDHLERIRLHPESFPLAGGMIAERRMARRDLDAAIEAIRSIPGYESFLVSPRFKDVVAVATIHPLVYLATTDVGGMALIVRGGREPAVKLLELPQLTESVVREVVQGYNRASQSDDRGAWMATLDETTGWLWDVLMGALVEKLSPSRQVALVPTGLLGFLPLHAAWAQDPSAPTGRRYALDHLLVTYAPNARTLRVAQRQAEQVRTDGVLVVEDPRPVRAPPLTYARNEAQATIAGFRHFRHLRGEQATKSAVLAAMGQYPVLHFACLGAASPHEPWKSGLLMANDEVLSLHDLIDQHLPEARLAVLSASETAVTGLELPDELIGLPVGLLQAGVASVISSLWSVSDIAAMMLTARFYELWRREGLEPAEALRQAQRWIRDTPNAAKRDHFSKVSALGGTSVPLRAREFWEEARSYAHPYHWAAFTYLGA